MKLLAWLVVATLVTGCARNSSRRVSGNGTEAFDASVELDGFGYGSIVFVDALREEDAYDTVRVGVVNAISIDPNTGFGAPVEIFSEPSFGPRVVHDPYDGARFVWYESVNVSVQGHGKHGHIWSVRQSVDGAWHPIVKLDDGDAVRGSLDIDSDGYGRALATWERDEKILASTAAKDFDFRPAVEVPLLAGASEVDDSVLAVNGAGFAVLVVTTTLASGERVIAVSYGDVANGFGAPERIDATGNCRRPAVEFAVDGTIVVAWQQELADGSIEVAVRRNVLFSGWTAEETLATTSSHLGNRTALAIDWAGFVTLAWQQDESTFGDGLRVARSDSDGPFDAPWDPQIDLSGAANFQHSFDLAADPLTGCVALVGALRDDPMQEAVGMRFQPVSGVWSAARGLDPVPFTRHDYTRGVDVAADASGTSIAVWIHEGSVHAIRWLPPIAEFVTLPDPPSAGQPTTLDGSLSRARTDEANLVTFEWDVDGDGLFEAQGEFLPATFATPGVHPVTLRVTDDWGDESVLVRNVLVQ